MKPSGYFHFDIDKIAIALGISVEDTRLYFTDGRRVSFLIERRAVEAIPSSRLAPSEGSGYDLITADGGHWEVRSLTRGGIYFCPSYMVGSGRKFDEVGFLEKLDDIKGYIVTDVQSFPSMPYWIISDYIVEKWWYKGQLGSSTKINPKKFRQLIESV